MKRTSKKVVANVSTEDAENSSLQYANAATQLAKIEAEMNTKINAIKEKYQDKVTDLKEAMDDQLATLECYAKEQQPTWGKAKSTDLMHCRIGFRTGTPKVDKNKKFTWDAITELLSKAKGFSNFIRTKQEINKEAIIAEQNPEIIKQLEENFYVKVVQDETFFVEVKKEEVGTN